MRILYASLVLLLLATACVGLGTAPEGAPPAPAPGDPGEMPADLPPIQVESVQVEVGVGSPIPVEIVVGGTWPHLCAQLAQADLTVDGTDIDLRLLASVEPTSCPEDRVGLAFRLAFPLNMAEMEPADYSVTVNGVATSFRWDPAGGAQSPDSTYELTYLGLDGNVWLLAGSEAEPRPLTTDATGPNFDLQTGTSIGYSSPKISGDGEWVAYRREVGTPSETYVDFKYGLWIHKVTTGEARQVLEQSQLGFAWKPGTHLLGYGLTVPEEYFQARGTPPNPSLADGILAIDADTDERTELVAPERGYSLAGPHWSPDGRLLGFDEIAYMEGRGPFAYYDFDAGAYVAWEEPIGNYDWNPDGSQIVYDRLTYTAAGDEEIYTRSMQGEGERALTDFPAESEYAFSPVLSPNGDQIAYLAGVTDVENQTVSLKVQDLAGGESASLGTFDSVLNLAWSPDGQWLLFSHGTWDSQQLLAVHAASGATRSLGEGTMPTVAGG